MKNDHRSIDLTLETNVNISMINEKKKEIHRLNMKRVSDLGNQLC